MWEGLGVGFSPQICSEWLEEFGFWADPGTSAVVEHRLEERKWKGLTREVFGLGHVFTTVAANNTLITPNINNSTIYSNK